MNTAKSITFGIVAALAMVGTVNADISYALNSSDGVFISPHPTPPGTTLPVDSWYQVWWSADATTINSFNGGDVQVSTAGFTTIGGVDPASFNGSGDYLLAQGGTPTIAGFPGNSVSGVIRDVDVGGNDADVGFMYAILYYEPVVPKGSTSGLATAPSVGASSVISEIRMTSAMSPFADGGIAPPASDPSQWVDFGGGPTIDDGSHEAVIADVVPEPGTMALFALGIATIAWRRRKK